jgi:hypothetical protein
MWLREMRSCPNLLCKYPPTLTSDLTLGHYRRLASPALAYSSATAPDDGRREQGFGLRLAGVNPQALLLGRFRAHPGLGFTLLTLRHVCAAAESGKR